MTQPSLEDFAKHDLTMDEARNLIQMFAAMLPFAPEGAGASVADFVKPLDTMARNLRRNMSLIHLALDEYEKRKEGGNE